MADAAVPDDSDDLSPEPAPSIADVRDEPVGDWVRIANEFTTARVRKVWTRNGERLEIQSTKMGTTIRLDPLELESLTWQDTETFSSLLKDPYGPEDVQPRALSELMADRQEVSFSDDDARTS